MADTSSTPVNNPASIQPDMLSWPDLTVPNHSNPAMRLAANAKEVGKFTPASAATASVDGQVNLSGGAATPCATCKKEKTYSIAFQIKDANGNLCKKGKNQSKGMNYTVKYKISGEVYTGSTDKDGLTERYFSSESTETIYIYIGNRIKGDGYPTDQSETINQIDEAPIAGTGFSVAPIAEKKSKKSKQNGYGSHGKLRLTILV